MYMYVIDNKLYSILSFTILIGNQVFRAAALVPISSHRHSLRRP